jgi:hypothetical protein
MHGLVQFFNQALQAKLVLTNEANHAISLARLFGRWKAHVVHLKS